MISIEAGKPAEGTAAKIALRQLINDSVKNGQTAGLSLSELQEIAFHDMRKDENIERLKSFATAASEIVYLPRFVESFGADAAPRIALQFVYQYFERGRIMSYSEEVFESTYDDLINKRAQFGSLEVSPMSDISGLTSTMSISMMA